MVESERSGRHASPWQAPRREPLVLPDNLVVRSALVADALDAIGLRSQGLRWDITPLQDDSAVLVGPAFTVSVQRVTEPPPVPYQGLLKALDMVGPGEVFVIPTLMATDVAVWGELIATACLARGVAGMITDGLVRDARQVMKLGFPVFARGRIPYDSNGRIEIVAIGAPIQVGGVSIHHGDVIVADADGVVVVPRDLANDVLMRASAKNDDEGQFREAVRRGAKPSEAYAATGVL